MTSRTIWTTCMSACGLILAIILSVSVKGNLIFTITMIILTNLSSCFLFPILVGQYTDKYLKKKDFDVINEFYQDFLDGGIIRVYKDRERSEREDNGENALIREFINHKSGEIKLVGVSLRVFFNPTKLTFYGPITELLKFPQVKIKALINSNEAPETINRGVLESPDVEIPTIITDMQATIDNIKLLKSRYGDDKIDGKRFMEAPYCTAIIFLEKCFFSPNILSQEAPVRLPLIVFRKGSHGYNVVNDYFDYLWGKDSSQKIESESAYVI